MKQIATICVAALALAACASNGLTTVQNATLTACNGYAAALRSITPSKPKMTPAQIDKVNLANTTTAPICGSATPPDNDAATALVQDATASLTALAAALTGGK